MPRKFKNVLGFRPYANYSPESLEECLQAIRIKQVTQRAAEKKEFFKQHSRTIYGSWQSLWENVRGGQTELILTITGRKILCVKSSHQKCQSEISFWFHN